MRRGFAAVVALIWAVCWCNGGPAPLRWTDADGTSQCVEPGGDPKFSVIGLRELLKLVDALGGRRYSSER